MAKTSIARPPVGHKKAGSDGRLPPLRATEATGSGLACRWQALLRSATRDRRRPARARPARADRASIHAGVRGRARIVETRDALHQGGNVPELEPDAGAGIG